MTNEFKYYLWSTNLVTKKNHDLDFLNKTTLDEIGTIM